MQTRGFAQGGWSAFGSTDAALRVSGGSSALGGGRGSSFVQQDASFAAEQASEDEDDEAMAAAINASIAAEQAAEDEAIAAAVHSSTSMNGAKGVHSAGARRGSIAQHARSFVTEQQGAILQMYETARMSNKRRHTETAGVMKADAARLKRRHADQHDVDRMDLCDADDQQLSPDIAMNFTRQSPLFSDIARTAGLVHRSDQSLRGQNPSQHAGRFLAQGFPTLCNSPVCCKHCCCTDCMCMSCFQCVVILDACAVYHLTKAMGLTMMFATCLNLTLGWRL